jgi:hypothetical protein
LRSKVQRVKTKRLTDSKQFRLISETCHYLGPKESHILRHAVQFAVQSRT